MGGCCNRETVTQQTTPNTIPRVQTHDQYVTVDDNVDDDEESWDHYDALHLSDKDEGALADDEAVVSLLIPRHKLETAASVIDILMSLQPADPVDTDQKVNENDKDISDNEKVEDQTQDSETDEHKVSEQQKVNVEIANMEKITIEAEHVHSWLKIDSNNKYAVETLRSQLASLLTIRSQSYKEKLKEVYQETYEVTLMRDIKAAISHSKGYAATMHIISGLLMSAAHYDSALLIECITKMDILAVGDIICCRSIRQLKELCVVYKEIYKSDIKTRLKAIAQNEKKKTLLTAIDAIFDLEKQQKENVDMEAIEEDLNFLLNTKKFKDNNKERLVMIFMANRGQYIKILNEKFEAKSKDNLVRFIEKKLGNKSSVGYFCKIRILYVLDSADYYAQKIRKLGKNEKKIANIFIQRMEIDLGQIKKVWMVKKYGDGKDLKQWITQKISASNSLYFLQKMLDNCSNLA